jgi:hypothetical protein
MWRNPEDLKSYEVLERVGVWKYICFSQRDTGLEARGWHGK